MIPSAPFPRPVRGFVAAALACFLFLSAFAAETRKVAFDLPAGGAGETLKRFAQQAEREIVYAPESVSALRTPALKGDYRVLEALALLLANSGFTAYEDPQTGALTLQPVASPNGPRVASENPTGAHPESARGTGTLRGVVVSEETGNYLEGVAVTVSGLPLATVTDSQGRFVLGGVPAGEQRLRVESTAAAPADVPVTVLANGSTPVAVRLVSTILQMQQMLVTAQVEGQALALNIQQRSDNIRKVATQDALANSREGQVGEALQSLPGIYLEISTHQPSRPNIRGVSSAFNSVTFDGIRVTNSDGSRDTGVGAFPAESLNRVELMKSVTPDMEGDAIGGSINLVSISALDLSAPLARVTLGGAFNNQQRNWNKQVNLAFGDRYGPDGRLGIYSSLNHYRSDRGYHTSTIAYSVDAQDNFNISSYTLQDRVEDDSWRFNYTGSFDYQLSDQTVISVGGLYSHDARYLEDRTAIFRPGTRFAITPDSASSRNGRVDLQRQYREPVSTTGQIRLGAQHTFDLWNIDYKAAFSESDNHYDETFYPLFSVNGVDLSYDRTVREFPVFRVDNGIDLNDPARLSHRQVSRTQLPTTDRERTLDFNARRQLDRLPFAAALKAGARAKFRRWEQGVENLGYWTYTGPRTAGEMAEVYVNDRFFHQAGGTLLFPTLYPDISAFQDAFANRPGEFTRQDATSDIFLASSVQSTSEDIYAGYLMGTATFRRLDLVTGFRVEHTDYAGEANQIETVGGVISAIHPQRYTSRYTNVLPGLHLNYRITPRFLVRASLNKTLARPNGLDLLPTRRVNDDARTVTDGNPGLEVTESVNTDLSVEYYLKPIGVVSLGAFNKEIDGFYFDSTSTITGGEYDGYRLTRPDMGRGGRVRGLEVEWQQRLSFLPAPFDGIGIGANYTWLDSEGRYPTRPDSDGLTFVGTAPRNGNFNLSYTRGSFDVRAFYNYRSDYLSSVGARRALDNYELERATVDLSAKWAFARRYSVYASAKNLTDEPKISYQGDPSNPRTVRYYDWAVNFGLTIDL
ncbi:TonB-dependent receptor [Opitutaceae bacterium]